MPEHLPECPFGRLFLYRALCICDALRQAETRERNRIRAAIEGLEPADVFAEASQRMADPFDYPDDVELARAALDLARAACTPIGGRDVV